MYDELVKELRDSAEWADRLALLMGRTEGDAHAPVMRKAADAIEELIAKLNHADDQIDLLVEASEERRWIPVTEQCPEKSGDYLVFDDCRNLYVNEWHYLLKKWQYDDSRITHWQPLPEPPKEEA